jgi:hypothetical protein
MGAGRKRGWSRVSVKVSAAREKIYIPVTMTVCKGNKEEEKWV